LTHYLILAGSWLLFYAIHSLTASNRFKRRVADCCPAISARYRLLYNAFSSITILVPLAIILLHPGPMLWQWEGISWWIMNLLALLAVAGFLVSSRHYDMAAFLGLRRNHHSHIGEAGEPFTLSPFHRYVRHPWYFFGLVLIWTRDMPLSWGITCVLATLYFIVGTKWEEDKLINEYGERYRRYQQKVPALVPLPWKYLSADEAQQLTSEQQA